MSRFIRYLLAGLALAAATPALACDKDDTNGLDVGLVLSGGGAKASTQIGVMQIMDELDIPVHCITGTSMGAVVGSFYANGYTADEIADILTDNDWGALFRGGVPRRDKSFVEKEREASYFSGNVASYGPDGLKLPGGLASMQGLKTYYRQILSDVPLDMDFDDLIIPYRAVATNLHKGQKTVFKDGDLVESILASMAVPGVFAPRQIDGELYVDGGLSSNLPIQTAKEMGADIIIAIDVSNEPPKPDRSISVASTANQITTIIIWQKVQEELASYDGELLHLQPNENLNIPTAGYERAAEGLEAGRHVGESVREQLLAIKAKAAPSRRNPGTYKIELDPDTFRIVNTTPIKDSIVKRRFNWTSRNAGDKDETGVRLRDLASFGGFGEVDIGRSSGETVLTLRDNPLGRNLVQVGLNASNDFDGTSSYSILARITRKPLGPRGGDLSLSGELGTNLGLSAELYQPFGPKGRFFIQPEIFAKWERQPFELFGSRLADLWQRDLGIRGRIGRELGNWGIIALEGGFQNRHISNTVDFDEDFKSATFDIGAAGLYLGVDTLDRNDWPRSGQKLRATARRIFNIDDAARTEIDQYEAAWLGAFEVKGLQTLINIRHGTSPDRLGFGSGSFALGGFRQLGSFPNNSILIDEYTYASLEVFERITAQGRLLDFPVYVGAIGEIAQFPIFFFEEEEETGIISGTLYLGIDTPLGPAFLGGAYGSDDERSLFFKFGRTF